jgi:hypothetical protein
MEKMTGPKEMPIAVNCGGSRFLQIWLIQGILDILPVLGNGKD